LERKRKIEFTKNDCKKGRKKACLLPSLSELKVKVLLRIRLEKVIIQSSKRSPKEKEIILKNPIHK